MQVDRSDPLRRQQATRVGHVLAGGQHLLGLINDVLDLTSIDQGAFTLAARDVDLAALLRDCVQRVEPLARRAGWRSSSRRREPTGRRMPIRCGSSRCSSTCCRTRSSTTGRRAVSRSACGAKRTPWPSA